MIITNTHKLPQTIVDAVTFAEKDHTRGDYSVTELPKGVKQLWLTRRHYDKITVDAVERLWALFGTAIHYVLDKGEDKDVFKEEKLEVEILGRKVTGKSDHFNATLKIVSDWKFTSVWTPVYKSSYPDIERQLNCYAFMYGLVGFEVEKLQAVLLLRDWSKNKAKEGGNYPSCQMKVVPFPLWTAAKARQYIEECVREFEKYQDMADDDLPVCTPEQRWHKGDKWAVMKEGNKRAVKGGVKDTEKEAVDLALETKNGYVQPRPGEDTKCIDYCDCKKFCNYWQKTYNQ